MGTKIVFHILTAISASLVIIVSILRPFQNKTIIICVLVLIGLIFQIAIPFLKTSRPLQLTYSLKLLDSNYWPEVEVDGVKWEKGFKRYSFELQSKSGSLEAYDVRLSFVLPTGIVSYKVLSQSGCEDLSFPTPSASFHHISKEGAMIDQIPFYQNVYYINVLRLFPKAYLKVHFILTYNEEETFDKKYGVFDIEYKYKGLSENEKDSIVCQKFPILFEDTKTKGLKIDTTKQAGPEYKFYHVLIPKTAIKIPFEKGHGIKLHNLPSRLKEQQDDTNKQ